MTDMIKTKEQLLAFMDANPKQDLKFAKGVRQSWYWMREGKSSNATKVHSSVALALIKSGKVVSSESDLHEVTYRRVDAVPLDGLLLPARLDEGAEKKSARRRAGRAKATAVDKGVKLKVYGVNIDGRSRGIVAATSQGRAAIALDMTLGHLRTYGCETGNPEEVELAMQEPGVAWRQSFSGDKSWKRIGQKGEASGAGEKT